MKLTAAAPPVLRFNALQGGLILDRQQADACPPEDGSWSLVSPATVHARLSGRRPVSLCMMGPPVVPEEKRMLIQSSAAATWGLKWGCLGAPAARKACQDRSPSRSFTCSPHRAAGGRRASGCLACC